MQGGKEEKQKNVLNIKSKQNKSNATNSTTTNKQTEIATFICKTSEFVLVKVCIKYYK